MKKTAGFRARQRVLRTVISTLLFLAVDAYVSLDAAAAGISLPEVSPALCPLQGILVVYSERYVVEDDGVLVFRRRPVEVYTDNGQLVGSYAPTGDAPIRLDVPPGNYIVAFQREGALQKVRAFVKDGEETIVPESPPEPFAPRASVSPR
jgi:hypothetical protein